MADRRGHDPFAPHETAEPTTDDGLDDEGQVAEDVGDGLETLRKDELIDLATGRGVAIYGTKNDIIERLRNQ